MDSPKILHKHVTSVILGAFYSIHSKLGYGFLEAVYGNALGVVLRQAGLRVQRQVPFEIVFHGEVIGYYRADFVVESRIVVEIKSMQTIAPIHVSQLINYLKASRLEVGLLLNFGESARFRRVIWTKDPPRVSVGSAQSEAAPSSPSLNGEETAGPGREGEHRLPTFYPRA